MQYMLLIYTDPANETPESRQAQMPRWFDYTRQLREAGALVGADALESVATATSVRNRNGDTTHTDGPFAETKERLGGYYLIDVENLDDALKWAAKCPAADTGTMEVRPIMVLPTPD